MRLRLVILLAAVVSLAACAQASQPTPKTEDDKALYALGVILSQNIKSFDFTDKELALVKAGLADGAQGKETMDPDKMEAYVPKLQALQTTRVAAATKKEKEVGAAYIAKAAKESGAQTTASGLVFKSEKEGTGDSPKPTDTVTVKYEGKFVDGKVFDSSSKHKEPSTFPLNGGVIPCWTEGLQLMKVGGKAQIVCPPDLAYGDQDRQGMRGGATLVFDVQLLSIEKPADVAAAAAAAAKAAGAPPKEPAK